MSATNQPCVRCGAPIPSGAAFCPSCGSQVSRAGSGQQPGTPAPQSQYPAGRREKQEKQEKGEKGEKNEKGRGGDITGAVTGGLILIWLGVTFFLQENNYIASGNWWAYFLMGIGAILILQGFLRYAMNRRPILGSFIGGAVVFLIGFAFVQGVVANLWPLILVVIGAAVLLSAVVGRQRRPAP